MKKLFVLLTICASLVIISLPFMVRAQIGAQYPNGFTKTAPKDQFDRYAYDYSVWCNVATEVGGILAIDRSDKSNDVYKCAPASSTQYYSAKQFPSTYFAQKENDNRILCNYENGGAGGTYSTKRDQYIDHYYCKKSGSSSTGGGTVSSGSTTLSPSTGSTTTGSSTSGFGTDVKPGDTVGTGGLGNEPIPPFETADDTSTATAPSITFTAQKPGVVEKKNQSVSVPFTLNNIDEDDIALPRGFLIKKSGIYEKHITHTSGSAYTFDWNPSQSDLGSYSLRIVVREKASDGGAVGGKLLLQQDTPIELVAENAQPPGKIVFNNPSLIDKGGKPVSHITGTYTKGATIKDAATKIDITVITTWSKEKQSVDIPQTHVDVPIKSDGTFEIDSEVQASTSTLAYQPTASGISRAYAANGAWNTVKGWYFKGQQIAGKTMGYVPGLQTAGKVVEAWGNYGMKNFTIEGKAAGGGTITDTSPAEMTVNVPSLGVFSDIGTYLSTLIMRYGIPIAVMAALILIMYAGWHYIHSGGSPEGQKLAKELIVGALLGLLVLFMIGYALTVIIPQEELNSSAPNPVTPTAPTTTTTTPKTTPATTPKTTPK